MGLLLITRFTIQSFLPSLALRRCCYLNHIATGSFRAHAQRSLFKRTCACSISEQSTAIFAEFDRLLVFYRWAASCSVEH
jgi:hypothetical protein